METNNRPEPFESVSGCSQIQDGNTRICEKRNTSGGMDNISRSDRCLSTYSHPQIIKKISKIPSRKQNLSIQSTSIWTSNSSTSFHKACKSYKRNGRKTKTRSQDPSISRRLDQQNSKFQVWRRKGSSFTRIPKNSRILSKPQEISISPSSEHRFHRLPLQPCKRYGISYRKENRSNPNTNPTVSSVTEKNCETINEHNRTISFHRKNGPIGQTSYEIPTVHIEHPMELQNVSRISDQARPFCNTRSKMVGENREPLQRISITPPKTRNRNIHRCLKYRLGSPLSRFQCKRPMEFSRQRKTHKLPRIESSMVSTPKLSIPCKQQSCIGTYRQYNSCNISKQTRGDKIMGSLCPPLENTDMEQEEGNISSSLPYSREIECSGRSTVKISPDHSDRMVIKSSNFQGYNENLGNPTDRPVCNVQEQETPSICVTISRSNGLENGRNDNKLDRSEFLCLSTNQTPSTSESQNQERTLSRNSNSTKLATTSMVCKSSKHKSRRSHKTSSNKEAVKTAPLANISSKSQTSQSTCMESKLSTLQEQGFSKKVAERISKNQRNSTLNLYQSRWTKFLEWTGIEEDDINHITIPQIADFLTYLFEEKKFSTSTIEGYKSAIGNTLKYSGLKVLESQELKDLLKSFKRDKPKASRSLPRWDLSVVLSVMAEKPFEPLDKADIKFITWKTVFLVSLATGRRRSEIHAIIYDKVYFKEKENTYLLGLDPNFLSKNQLVDDISEKFKYIELKSLDQFLGKDLRADRVNCPVRALKIYIQRTKELRTEKRKLFVSFYKGKRTDIHPNTISYWLKTVISSCYNITYKENVI